MPSKLSISIQPLNYGDIPACARNTADAFAVDPHTAVKDLGSGGYDMYVIAGENIRPALKKKTSIYIKAVDDATGAVVGHMGWAFRRVDESQIPWQGPSDEPEQEQVAEEKLGGRPKRAGDVSGDEAAKDQLDTSSITKLHALENQDMQDWLAKIDASPPSMIILGCLVAPAYQGCGAGGKMMQYGNAIADKLGVPIRVHSSHQAYGAYQKAGFEAEKTLDLDLDEYAPRPPKEGEPVMGEAGKWGRYVIRYMIRTPEGGTAAST